MSEAAPIDDAALDALASGLPAGSLEAVLVTFAMDLARKRAAVSDALGRRNPEELRLLAHGIAGSAATFCAGSLARVATTLERVAAAGDWESVSAVGATLVAEADRVVIELRKRGGRRVGAQP